MSFMDELRKLTQPYDEDEDFFEGSMEPEKPEPQISAAQLEFESAFGGGAAAPEPEEEFKAPQTRPSEGGSFFGGFAARKQQQQQSRPQPAPRQKTVSFGGNETQVILFSPKSFDEAGELVNHLQQGRSVVMTLEGVPTENARRLLDFLSGIAFALQGKITPVSAKTYFVSPQNVDLLGAQSEQPLNEGRYF